MTPGRLWLVDDDDDLRTSFAQAMQSDDRLQLTGSHATADAALAAVRSGASFDVALIDLGLANASGVRLIGELRKLVPTAPLLAFTVRTDDAALFAALRAGASGYLTKEASLQEILTATTASLQGVAPLDRGISLRVVSRFWQCEAQGSNVSELTARERSVLEVLCTGASYRETARLLGIAEGTIQTHVKHIYEKLGVTSKAEAVRMAYEAGFALR